MSHHDARGRLWHRGCPEDAGRRGQGAHGTDGGLQGDGGSFGIVALGGRDGGGGGGAGDGTASGGHGRFDGGRTRVAARHDGRQGHVVNDDRVEPVDK